MRRHRPHLVLVGGFLGAGKTTLILAAARELAARGLKSAVILNDQGDSLVDTQLARRVGLEAGEVTGGCFCCRFPDLIESAKRLAEYGPDVIFAEPVGSCTDIASTVLAPLREAYSDDFRLAPFTVCVDPAREREIGGADSNPHLFFLFRNQFDEADLICYTKADLHPEAPARSDVRSVSARTGLGVAAWLDELLSGQLSRGGHRLDVDYEAYARAEAALAWMDLSVTIECDPALTSTALLGPLVDGIAAEVEVVHLKAIARSDAGFLKVALCGSREEPQVEGALDASPAGRHEILINLRAAGEPGPVSGVVGKKLDALLAEHPGCAIRDQRLSCFTPSPPKKP